jgi:type I restriction enzyme S subunit
MKEDQEDQIEYKQSGIDEIPKGWVWASIEDILYTLESGGRPKGGVRNIKEGIPSIGGEHLLYNGGFDFTEIRYVPTEFYEKMTRGKILKKDVLVVKDGATTGKTAFVSDSFPFSEAAVNEHVFILRVLKECTSPKYLFFWMQSPFGQQCVKDNFQGTAQGGINSLFVKNSSFPLPPLPEQHRIVAKIEELFTELDAGVEALKKIEAQIKRYRQAVLKYAFEGKLTEEWRKKHKDCHPALNQVQGISGSHGCHSELVSESKEMLNQVQHDTSGGRHDIKDLPLLPEGWVWTRLGEIAEINPKFNGNDVSDNTEVTFLPMKCVEELTGHLDLSNTRKLSGVKKGYTPFLEGDVLFAKITPCMENGKVAIAHDLKNGIGFGSTEFHVIRPPKNLLRRFLFFFLIREDLRKDAQRNMTGSAGQLRVPVSYMQQIPIPLPPLPEQHQIVSEIERRFSAADEAEKVVDNSLKQAERLRQSILKKAFEGKLVLQDPADEPAEKLLERIRIEKTKQANECKIKSDRRRRHEQKT